jgi:hydroxymethylglutaryl-CoA lyase
VNPKKAPQMTDCPEAFAGPPAQEDAVFIALTLNRRGVARAIAAGAEEINFVFCASDECSVGNIRHA